MVNLFTRYYINRSIVSLVLGSFSLTYVIPTQIAAIEFGFNEAAFLVRLEKLVEKMWKLEKSGNIDKMYETLIDIKTELEGYSGYRLDISNGLDQVEQKIKSSGVKVPKKQFESIRKSLKKKEKKANDHARYIASTMHLEGYEFNDYDEASMFHEPLMAKHGSKDKDKEDEKEEINVPAQLVFGVTLTLCGVFLMAVPIPACKVWGERMVQSGVIICGNCISNKVEEDKKKDKKQ